MKLSHTGDWSFFIILQSHCHAYLIAKTVILLCKIMFPYYSHACSLNLEEAFCHNIDPKVL